MNALTSERVGELVTEALERTAFVLVDTIEGDADDEFQPTMYSMIGFRGLANGSVLLAADDDFAAELASSMLGVEPEDVDPSTEGKDALNELANIVGGSIMIDLGGEHENYEYGLPQSLTDEQLPEATEGMVKSLLQSEMGLLEVTWLPEVASRSAAA